MQGTVWVDAKSQQTSPLCGKCGGRTTLAARVPDFSRNEQLSFYRCEMCRLITSTAASRSEPATSGAATLSASTC
jgi:hypothetical protein